MMYVLLPEEVAYMRAAEAVKALEVQLREYEYLLDQNQISDYEKMAAEMDYYAARVALLRAKRKLNQRRREVR